MALLPVPLGLDDSWLIGKRDYTTSPCRAMRGFGYEGEAMCSLKEGHPGDWHYDQGDPFTPGDQGTWFWDRSD